MEQTTEIHTTEPQVQTENSAPDFSRKFNLKFGYPDKNNPNVIHKEVVISRRPKGKNVLTAAFHSENINHQGVDVQVHLHIIASSISKFGSMKIMPPPFTALLSLNQIDREKLETEYFLFLTDTQPAKNEEQEADEENKTENPLAENCAKLTFGVERDGVKYDLVEFGHLISGFEEMELRRNSHTKWHFAAKKLASEVVKLSTSDGSSSIGGSLTIEDIEEIDATDFALLREVESNWLDSFRDEQ